MPQKYKNILLIGSTGLVGQAVQRTLKQRNYTLITPPSEEFDLTDQELMLEYIRHNWPDLIINCAAIPDVEENETDNEILPELVNLYGPIILAHICQDFGIPVVHFSTSYVFDGRKETPYTEQDAPCPLNRYGRFKMAADEAMLSESVGLSLVIRTSWVFGPGRTNFVSFIARKAQVGEAIEVTTDNISSPTYSLDLAEATVDLIEAGARGIVNVVNSGSANRAEMATIILHLASLKAEISIVPAEVIQGARRPTNSVLDNSLLQKRFKVKMRPWKEALKDYFKNYLREDILLSDDIVAAEEI
ncbi:MAG: NAD(P)-dependent oxidoreductase [Candidatus Brocadiia bacterium]